MFLRRKDLLELFSLSLIVSMTVMSSVLNVRTTRTMIRCEDMAAIHFNIFVFSFHLQRFRNTNNLLQQLSPDHTHLSLVVNLYSDERGYSLILNPGIYMYIYIETTYIYPYPHLLGTIVCSLSLSQINSLKRSSCLMR